MSMCRVVSWVVGRGSLLWPVHSLGKTLSAFALFHFVLQDHTYMLLQVPLYFLLLHSSPLWWKSKLILPAGIDDSKVIYIEFRDILTRFQILLSRFYYPYRPGASSVALAIKNPSASETNIMRLRFDPWVEQTPWRREWQPTPVFLPGEFHAQRSLVGYSSWGHKELDTTQQLTHIHIV